MLQKRKVVIQLEVFVVTACRCGF